MHTQPATACCAIHAVQPGRKSSVQYTRALVSTVQFVIVVNISHACRWKTIILHTCLSPFSSDTEHACCARQLCGALLYTTTTLPAFLRCVRVAWLTSLCIRWRCLPTLLLSPFLQGMTVYPCGTLRTPESGTGARYLDCQHRRLGTHPHE